MKGREKKERKKERKNKQEKERTNKRNKELDGSKQPYGSVL